MGATKAAMMAHEQRVERMREYAEEMFLILEDAVSRRNFYADINLNAVKALLREIRGEP